MLTRLKLMYQKIIVKTTVIYFSIIAGLSVLPFKILADSSPWGGSNQYVNPSNLQETISKDTIITLKIACIVVGTFLLMGGVMTIIHVLARDADERKQHGNSLITLLIAGLCCVVGVVLLGIAWKGLSYKPT